MTQTIKDRIVDAIKAKLDAIDSIPDLVVEINRGSEVQHFPSVVIVEQDADVDSEFSPNTLRFMMPLDIEAYARANDDDALKVKIDNLQRECSNALLADHTLGGLAADVTLTSIDRITGDDGAKAKTAAVMCSFEVMFFTAANDLTALA